MKTRRSFCNECKREWITPEYNYVNSAPCSISGNPLNGGNCPICGSPEITDVYFDPSFPGLDIPRDSNGIPVPHMSFAKPKPIEMIPGLSSNPLIIRQEPSILLLQNTPTLPDRVEYNIPEEKPPAYMNRIDYGE